MNKEKLGMKVNLEVVVRGPDGNVKDKRVVHNVTTTEGIYGCADNILASPTKGKPTHMAVGTGTPGANDLGAQTEDRHAFTSWTRSSAVNTAVGDWAAGHATAALTEAGIFDASTSGNMWWSASFSAINKGANDTLQITWTITFADA